MEQVKIFTGSASEVESKVDKWFKETKDIAIVSHHFQQCGNKEFSIAIFYQEKKEA